MSCRVVSLPVSLCHVMPQVMACDAKLNFDDNAEWRQKETFDFRDYTQEDTREVCVYVLCCKTPDKNVAIGCRS